MERESVSMEFANAIKDSYLRIALLLTVQKSVKTENAMRQIQENAYVIKVS